MDADDLVKLARITLRPAGEEPADADYDRDLSAWVVPDPDIRVVGHFHRPGAVEFTVGLIVGRSASFLQVVQADDRFVLTEGYDRAITLLTRGIHEVPAFVKTHVASKDLDFSAGGLDPGLVSGDVHRCYRISSTTTSRSKCCSRRRRGC